MRFASLFLVGYAVFLASVVAALWKLGVLERVGAEWTGIGFLIAVGIGVMLAIGGRRAIEIDRTSSLPSEGQRRLDARGPSRRRPGRGGRDGNEQGCQDASRQRIERLPREASPERTSRDDDDEAEPCAQ